MKTTIVPARVARRLEVCQACPHLAGVSLTRLSVLCTKQPRRCSCPNGELTLVSGRCADDPPRWPAASEMSLRSATP